MVRVSKEFLHCDSRSQEKILLFTLLRVQDRHRDTLLSLCVIEFND